MPNGSSCDSVISLSLCACVCVCVCLLTTHFIELLRCRILLNTNAIHLIYETYWPKRVATLANNDNEMRGNQCCIIARHCKYQ
jgi:hypothetical protein